MKKIILTAAAVLALAAGNAAADPKWFAGGSLNFGTAKHGDYKSSSFGISPNIGYIIDDKSDVSVSVGFSNSKIDADELDSFGDPTGNIISEKYSDWSVSAGYERLFLTVGSLYFYIWGGVEYSSAKIGDGDAQENFNISVAPNVQYGLTDNIILFADLNFLSLNFDTGDGYNDFSFGADSNGVINSGDISIGFAYLF
jgi:hypothetical protein